MQARSINYQQKNIHYKVYGEGQPVVLLHGFGEDSTVWKLQITALKDHFQLIVPDLPGSGDSELVPGADIETYADIVKAIVDIELPGASGQEPFLQLIGHSMGGYITLAFAEKYPQYLKSFGLFHSSAFADTEEKKVTRKKAIAFIREKGAAAFLKTSIPGLFTAEYQEAFPEKVEALVETAKKISPEALVQYYEAMIARPDRVAVLNNFNGPVLFLIGQHDTAVPFESSLQQCYLPAQSHVHILRQSAHMGMLEESEKSSEALLNFLSAL